LNRFCIIIDPNVSPEDQQQQGEEGDSATQNEGGDNQQGEEVNENPQEGETGTGDSLQSDPNQSIEAVSGNGTDTTVPPKKGLSWLPIIIIIASIAVILLIGLIILIVRKRNAAKGYNPTATSETAAGRK
jgi:hypothetical protein